MKNDSKCDGIADDNIQVKYGITKHKISNDFVSIRVHRLYELQ